MKNMPQRLRDLLKRAGPLVAVVHAGRAVRRACKPPLRRCLSRFTRRRQIEEYLRTHDVARLHLGCGKHCLDGWLNSDCDPLAGAILLDANRPFPLGDATVDRIFTEHMFEHVSYRRGLRMLRECRRVLKPGGRIRLATPNLRAFVDLFGEQTDELQQHYMDWFVEKYLADVPNPRPAHVLNLFVRKWGHQFVYDVATLTDAMAQAGFAEIVPCRPGQTDDDLFAGTDSHGRTLGDERLNEFETIVVEATRPA